MILCLVEISDDKVVDASLSAVSLGAKLAGETGLSLACVAIGEASDSVLKELGGFGVSSLYLASDAKLMPFAPAGWAKAVVTARDESEAKIILGGSTDRSTEVLARASAKLEAPFVANCLHVTVASGYQVSRLRWAGSIIEDAFVSDEPVAVFSAVQSDIAAPSGSKETEVQLRQLSFEVGEAELRDAVTEVLLPTGDGVSLSDSRIVIGGGRGVGSPEGFKVLDELAGILGATVGVSRVVTGLGWRPHKDQIGQTGTKIAPELYIACGISGAIQHMAGCRSAKCILAINQDRDAPIMSLADYAVVGDLHKILPKLIEELNAVGAKS
ncbi:MAG: electron transfer flavoprotein subunit alpha/FixB family protein [Acidimicrobiaceae bacterium]|nr:electron transfer flavoprotein subunit alpha/FixB family protein [Acidimicrobiaceae bacterium]